MGDFPPEWVAPSDGSSDIDVQGKSNAICLPILLLLASKCAYPIVITHAIRTHLWLSNMV